MQSLLPTKPQHYVWPLAALCVITLFLFLGDTLFNTRGEPREAVVALSMLKEGNWVIWMQEYILIQMMSFRILEME